MDALIDIVARPAAEEPVVLDVAAPAHVPRHLIRDLRNFQGLKANSRTEPYDHTARMLEPDVPPVLWSPFAQTWITGGLWVFTRYRDCARLLQDPAVFGSNGQADFQRLIGETFKCIPLSFDGAQHAAYRRFLNPYFTARAVSALGDYIRDLANALIDECLDRGGVDFAHDFARIFPVKVFFRLMGFPESELEQFLDWENDILHSRDFARMGRAVTGVLVWLRGFIEQKRREPDAGLTATIVNGTIADRPLTDDERIGAIFFLWLGGLDTVASTLVQMFRRLALDPALQARLRAEPALIPGAIEEFLRMQPLVNNLRQLNCDLTLHGVAMKRGDWCMGLTTVANFDPEAFPDPRRFDPERKANRHFTFASGSHLCMGAHLARQEMRIALELWLARVPTFALAGEADRVIVPSLLSASRMNLTWAI
jgi:cytochrome P450